MLTKSAQEAYGKFGAVSMAGFVTEAKVQVGDIKLYQVQDCDEKTIHEYRAHLS